MVVLQSEADITSIAHIGLIYVSIRELRPTIRKRRVSEHEMIGPGWLGLNRAENNFDPDFGVKFSTFAIPRIKGSMLDELRTRDHLTRDERMKVSRFIQAEERLAQALKRKPNLQELQTALGYDRVEFDKVRALAYPCFGSSFTHDSLASVPPDFDSVYEAHSTFCALTRRMEHESWLVKHVFNLRFADNLTRAATIRTLKVTEWRVREAEKRILDIASFLN